MAAVGGDPAKMTGGAAVLNTQGGKVHAAGPGLATALNSVAGAAGEADLAAAARRFAAAISTAVQDVGTQTTLAARLAENAAHDLSNATGGS